MTRGALVVTYFALLVVLLSMFLVSSSTLQLVKYIFLVVLAYMILRISSSTNRQKVYHAFLGVIVIIFAIYASLYGGLYYFNILLELLVAAGVGFLLAFMYKPVARKKKVLPPRRPIVRPEPVVEPVAKKTKKAAKKKVAKKTKKASTKKTAKKTSVVQTTKRPARRATKKATTKTVAKKSSTTQKTAKKSTSRSRDAQLIACGQEHEMSTVLLHFNKKNDKDNRKALQALCKNFKNLKTFKPHNRVNFYRYLEQSAKFKKLR